MIPYITRTSDVILSSQLQARDVNIREIIDDFRSQSDDFDSLFEAFVLMAPWASAHNVQECQKAGDC